MQLDVQVILVDPGSVVELNHPIWEGVNAGLAANAMRTGHWVCLGESTEMLVRDVAPEGVEPLFRSRMKGAQSDIPCAKYALVGREGKVVRLRRAF